MAEAGVRLGPANLQSAGGEVDVSPAKVDQLSDPQPREHERREESSAVAEIVTAGLGVELACGL